MDKATGGIEAHVVMDVLTWIETFFLNLTRNGDNSTRVIMDRIGGGSAIRLGNSSSVY